MPILSDHYNLPPEVDKPQQNTGSHITTLKTDTPFTPEIGKCYEVHFGKVTIEKKKGFGSARIKVNGQVPSKWIDLDTGETLDSRFGQYVVQAFKEIECPVKASGT